jgi:HJR/Mrr/RecB family endonuclease
MTLAAGTDPLRSGLFGIAGLFTAVSAILLAKAVVAWRFLNAYHAIMELRTMDPFEFEHYIANLFLQLGYAAKVIGGSGDTGDDAKLALLIRKVFPRE